MAKNEKCAASDSALCRWIGKDCGECHIRSVKHDDEVKKLTQDFEVTMSLLPDDIDDLMGQDCQLCKGERRPRSGYALIDLAHQEPKSETGMFFGLGKKVRRKVGSLMPLSISVCGKCRKILRISELLKWISAAVFLAIAIAALAIPGLRALGEGILFAMVAAGVLLGYLAGKAVSAAYVKAKSKDVRFNVFEIPICAKMQDAGWFTMQDDTPVTRYIFSRRPHMKAVKNIRADEKEGAGEDS